jgi:hypothetical protein
MPWPQARTATAGALAILACCTSWLHAGSLRSSASCGDGNSITFTWTFTEHSGLPTGHPEWVGYDVYRRTVDDCGAFVRVNDSPYPRTQQSHGHTLTEVPPSRATTYEYRLTFVDADRQEVDLGYDCYECARSSWASCPQLSAAVTHGTLEDHGLLYVMPCGCYTIGYIEGSAAEQLRQYAGTDQAVRIYGYINCGQTEGCAIFVDHYELAPCLATPARRASWGEVKAIYR